MFCVRGFCVRRLRYAVARLYVLLFVGVFVAGCGSVNHNRSLTPSSGPANNAGGMSVPMLDGWWDSGAGGLRIEYGLAGSASQGAPIYNDGSYSGAAVCARKRIALLTTASGSLYVTQLPEGVPQLIVNDGVGKAQIAFSPSCAAAVAFASGDAKAFLIEGLFTAPKAVAVSLPVNASATAVADSGSLLVSVPQTDGSAALELMTAAESAFQPLTVVSKFGGMAFVPGSDAVMFADAGSNSVMQASGIGTQASVIPIASSADGISHPLAINVSADGHTLAVANGVGAGVVRIDLSRHAPASQVKCACAPAQLKAMGSNAAFRLNEPGAGTVWAFDADAQTPRIVFVPSAEAASKAQGAKR